MHGIVNGIFIIQDQGRVKRDDFCLVSIVRVDLYESISHRGSPKKSTK